MQKKAFTILELALIVAMLWLIFGMTRNFFNVWRQKKLVFWETCLNYVFGEIDKFQTDIKYGKLPVTVSGLDGVYSIRLYGTNSWSFLHSSWFGWMTFEWIWNDFATIQTYKHISLSSNNFAPLNNVPIPESCYSTEFTIVWKPSIFARALQIAIPAVKTTDSQWFIGDDWETNLNPQITWEVTYSVCGLQRGQINPARWSLLDTSECLEVGKVNVDRRSETINFLKCARTNEQTWICSLWPRLN